MPIPLGVGSPTILLSVVKQHPCMREITHYTYTSYLLLHHDKFYREHSHESSNVAGGPCRDAMQSLEDVKEGPYQDCDLHCNNKLTWSKHPKHMHLAAHLKHWAPTHGSPLPLIAAIANIPQRINQTSYCPGTGLSTLSKTLRQTLGCRSRSRIKPYLQAPWTYGGY